MEGVIHDFMGGILSILSHPIQSNHLYTFSPISSYWNASLRKQITHPTLPEPSYHRSRKTTSTYLMVNFPNIWVLYFKKIYGITYFNDFSQYLGAIYGIILIITYYLMVNCSTIWILYGKNYIWFTIQTIEASPWSHRLRYRYGASWHCHRLPDSLARTPRPIGWIALDSGGCCPLSRNKGGRVGILIYIYN